MATAYVNIPWDIELVSIWSGGGTPSTDVVEETPGIVQAVPAGSIINAATLSFTYYYPNTASIYSIDGNSMGDPDAYSNVTQLVRDCVHSGTNHTFVFRFKSDRFGSSGSQTCTVSNFRITIDYTPGSSTGTLNKGSVSASGSDTITLKYRIEKQQLYA